jgi:hypothetical protein
VEERIRELEMQISDMRVDNAKLGVQVDNFAGVAKELSENVEELVSAFNKIKGAVWILGPVAAGIGAVAHWLSQIFTTAHNQ